MRVKYKIYFFLKIRDLECQYPEGANRSFIFVYMSKFILLQTLLHICSGHETTLLRAAKDPQLDRLDKLATSVNQLETTTSSNVQQNVASSSIDPSTTRFQTTEMNVQDAKEIKDRIQATRTKLQQVETKIQDYKLKSKETTSSSTSQEKNTVSDDDKQNSAAKLSDAPSDRPLHNSETVQSVEREADHAVHELNRFGNSRKTQIASVPTAGVARSVSVSQSNPSNPMNPSVASAASTSVPSNAAAAASAASAARTTAVTQAPAQTPTSFAASIPPIEAGELEFPQFPEAGTSQATRQDDASTEDAWAETDAMAERMSEGGGGSMGAQFMPPNQQQQQMDPRMMQQ